MNHDQRKDIIELLFPEYWRPEAAAILDSAIGVGYSLDQIAYAITRFGVDPLITSTFHRSLRGDERWIDWACTVGPSYPAPIPLINFGALELGT